jgi:Holliday junction resolvase RusA-like endonuclease
MQVLASTIPCYTGPIEVQIGAYFKRPPTTSLDFPVPDVDNIAKAVMDGIQGVSFKNDKQVITLIVNKAWSEPGRPGFIIVNIVPIEAEE